MPGKTVGFIGLGKMGARMASRLLSSGKNLIVFDTDSEALSHLASEGASVATSLQEVAENAEVVLASLPTPEVVKAVAIGPGGISAGSAVRVFIDLSTTGPKVSLEIHSELKRRGIASVDCPVSGGLAGAKSGGLTLMVSCDKSVFDDISPLLHLLGNPVFVSSQPGSAQIMKLANNLLASCALAITAEAIVFGVKGGLDPSIMCEIFNQSSGRNTATLDKFPKSVLTGSFDFGFSTGLAYKDVRLCLDEAEAMGVPTPVGSAVRSILSITQAQYGADSDWTNIVKPFEQWAGVEARSNI